MQETKKQLGLWTSTSLVVGNMIGAGVFLMPAALAKFGGISLMGWVFAAIGAFLIAKVFAHLSKLFPAADGGPYAYSQKGLGDFAGFLVAWGYLVSVWCTNAAITVSFISALSTFFPALISNAYLAIATGLATIWFLSWINSLGILTSGILQLITTILKIVPIVLIGLVGLFYIQWHHFLPFNASDSSNIAAITATTTLTFFAFLGIECATIPSGSVANASSTVAKATTLGTLIATVVYILGSVSVMGMIPSAQLKTSVTPFADAAVFIWGQGAKYWVSAGVAISAFGALNGYILIQGQMPYAIAKDGLFPKLFTQKNKHGVPIFGIVISSIFVSLFMAMNYTKGLVEQFQFLMLLTTATILIPYFFCTAAYVRMRIQSRGISNNIIASAIVLAALTILFCIWIVIGLGYTTVLWGLVLTMSALPFYILAIWKRNKNLKNKL